MAYLIKLPSVAADTSGGNLPSGSSRKATVLGRRCWPRRERRAGRSSAPLGGTEAWPRPQRRPPRHRLPQPRLFELRRRDLRARHGRRARASRPGLGRRPPPVQPAGASPGRAMGRGPARASRAAARMAASCAATWKRRATPRPPPASRKPPRCAPPPRAAQRHAPRHRPPPERKQADRAALLPDGGLPHGRAAGAARAGQPGRRHQAVGQ